MCHYEYSSKINLGPYVCGHQQVIQTSRTTDTFAYNLGIIMSLHVQEHS